MRMFQLDPRLMLCAGFVRQGATLADIGTDHAYLPVWLISNGRCPRAAAVDVREGPLERARENVTRYGMTDRITLSLSDGLTAVSEEDADDIVIAGMGGELIANILSQAPWLRNRDKHLILQPMTMADELRRWLCNNGFALLREECVCSEGKIYSVMLAAYDPEAAAACCERELYPYIGLLSGCSEQEKEYIKKIIARLTKKKGGCLHRHEETEAKQIGRIIAQLENKIQQGGNGVS